MFLQNKNTKILLNTHISIFFPQKVRSNGFKTLACLFLWRNNVFKNFKNFFTCFYNVFNMLMLKLNF
jgi:hypothetical protein